MQTNRIVIPPNLDIELTIKDMALILTDFSYRPIMKVVGTELVGQGEWGREEVYTEYYVQPEREPLLKFHRWRMEHRSFVIRGLAYDNSTITLLSIKGYIPPDLEFFEDMLVKGLTEPEAVEYFKSFFSLPRYAANANNETMQNILAAHKALDEKHIKMQKEIEKTLKETREKIRRRQDGNNRTR